MDKGYFITILYLIMISFTNKAEDIVFNSYDEFYGYYDNATESYKDTLNKFPNI